METGMLIPKGKYAAMKEMFLYPVLQCEGDIDA